MKVALIGDSHAGARNDSIVFNEYFTKFYEDVFFPYLTEHNIKTIVHLGDVFDRRKFVNFRILNHWNKKIFPLFSKFDTHIIIGNHDTYYKHTNRINSVQELCDDFPFKIYEEATEVILDKTKILFVPWMNGENYDQTVSLINKTKAKIVMGHLELIGFSMQHGVENLDHGISPDIFSKFKSVFSGHFHHGSSRGNVRYIGSPYEITWADYGDPKGFAVFDTNSLDVEFVQNPNVIYKKLEYNEDEKIDEKDLEQYAGCYVKVVITKRENERKWNTFNEAIHKKNPIDVCVVDKVDDEFNAEEEIIDQTKDNLTIMLDWAKSLNLEYEKDVVGVLSDIYSRAMQVNDTI